MENLKSGDAPALVTNFEVMKILSKRLHSREHNEEDEHIEKRNSSKHPKLRHRDYIEQSVYDYIQKSPCGNLKDVNFSTMTQFVKKLRGRSNSEKKKGQTQTQQQSQIVDSKRPRNELVKTEEVGHFKQESSNEMEVLEDNENDNYGLTDAETLQILNHMPTLPVEIHLMIEDLTGRLSDDQQTSLLQFISDNSGR